MSITLPSSRDQERVEEAIRAASSPDGEPYTARIGLYANSDTEDLSGKLLAAQWGQAGIPITCEASLQGTLPRRLEDCQTRLVTEIDGVPIQQMWGEKTMYADSEDAHTTEIISSSTGSLFHGDDAIKLGRFTEYRATPPDRMVFETARRLPYNQNLIEIDAIPGVTLSYEGSGENPGFAAHEPTGAILDRIAATETAGYDYRDTAMNGLRATIPAPLSRLSGSEWKYHASRMPDWLKNRPKPPSVRYSDIRAYHIGADGNVAWEVIEEIPYQNIARPPHAGRTLPIVFDDDSAEGPDNARKRIAALALDIARGLSTGETLLPTYNPLIERLDTFSVVEPRIDSDGIWELLWAFRIGTYRHLYDGGSSGGSEDAGLLGTLVGYTATIIEEDRIRPPDLIVPAYSPGLVKLPPPPYGVSGNDIYFNSGLDWVAATGDDLIFYDSAPELATVSGDDIVVSQ